LDSMLEMGRNLGILRTLLCPKIPGVLLSQHWYCISRTNVGMASHLSSKLGRVLDQFRQEGSADSPALNEQKTEIRIQFKDIPSGIFKNISRNELIIRVQPNEAVYMKVNTKLPGLTMRTATTELDLTYKRRFSDLHIPEAYEALLLDAFKGDHSNFVRDDELDVSWRIFTPLLHYLDSSPEMYLDPVIRLGLMLVYRISMSMDRVDQRYWRTLSNIMDS